MNDRCLTGRVARLQTNHIVVFPHHLIIERVLCGLADRNKQKGGDYEQTPGRYKGVMVSDIETCEKKYAKKRVSSEISGKL